MRALWKKIPWHQMKSQIKSQIKSLMSGEKKFAKRPVEQPSRTNRLAGIESLEQRQVLSAVGIFGVGSPPVPGEETLVSFYYNYRNASYENEIGYYLTNADGEVEQIDTSGDPTGTLIGPGHADYRRSVLEAADVLFKSGEFENGFEQDAAELVAPDLRLLPSDGAFAFFAVQDATVEDAKSDDSINVWFSSDAANADGGAQHFYDHALWEDPPLPTDLSGGFIVFLEDLSAQPSQVPNARNYNYSDDDFDDAIFSFRNIRFDLDVDNDGFLHNQLVDGSSNYLPGQVGDDFVLSMNDHFNQAAGDYQAQEMQLVVSGAGLVAGEFDRVEFEIEETTSYAGWTGNLTDPAVEGEDNDDDVSFSEFGDLRKITATKDENHFRAPIFVKDTGAHATIIARYIRKNDEGEDEVLFEHELQTSKDTDGDKMADHWEEEVRQAFNTQFGLTEDDFDYRENIMDDMNPIFDLEQYDLDGPNNSDSGPNPSHPGHNMPERHDSTLRGDGLSLLAEYRGAKVDGGGYDGHGRVSVSGLTRFSMAYFDHLIEVDMMENVEHMPSELQMRGVLNTMTAGFSDRDTGAGIKSYYFIDDVATEHFIPSSTIELDSYLNEHRDVDLGISGDLDFLIAYLLYQDIYDPSYQSSSVGGLTLDRRSSVSVPRKHEHFEGYFSDDPVKNTDFTYFRVLARTGAHELTHGLIRIGPSDPNFDDHEHLIGEEFKENLLAPRSIENADTIIFSDPTRRHITKKIF